MITNKIFRLLLKNTLSNFSCVYYVTNYVRNNVGYMRSNYTYTT
ncbi:uncharacterized protein METZ01_LOCUS58403 [marine metagenome]|uniref:Uncharacterized protein n=1 Tax=marine metagenome TaxID=408172 RepID=A0A381SPY2_9ZZZZ